MGKSTPNWRNFSRFPGILAYKSRWLSCNRKMYASSRYWRTIDVTLVCVHHVTIHKRAKKKHHVVHFSFIRLRRLPVVPRPLSSLAVVVRPPRVVASSAACSPRVVGYRPLAQQPPTLSLRPPPLPALFSRSTPPPRRPPPALVACRCCPPPRVVASSAT